VHDDQSGSFNKNNMFVEMLLVSDQQRAKRPTTGEATNNGEVGYCYILCMMIEADHLIKIIC